MFQFYDLDTELDLYRILSGFHGAFATGVACQQGTLTLPDTWFRPPSGDLLVLQLLRPDSSNLPCLYSTFHLEYPLVLSRFCFVISLSLLLTHRLSCFSLSYDYHCFLHIAFRSLFGHMIIAAFKHIAFGALACHMIIASFKHIAFRASVCNMS